MRAFARFAREHPQATFTIAGDGPLLEPLRALGRELVVESKLRFPGFLTQEKLRGELDAAHVFMHPSEMGADGNQEGVPNSLLEAMSTGLPVIGSYHGGIPEAVEHGKTGYLIREGDVEGLTDALKRWTADPEGMATMGRAASEMVRTSFEQRTQAAKLESYYREAIDTWKNPRRASTKESGGPLN